MSEYFEIPCSCGDCMEELSRTGKALILKAKFKVGDKVTITKTGWNEYAKGQEKLDLGLNTIQDIREEDGTLMYTVYGLTSFLDDEIELGESNLIPFKRQA